jgi:sortase (surface protein transpeptidase)
VAAGSRASLARLGRDRWRWQEPFTSLWTAYQQRQLASAYEEQARDFQASSAAAAAANPVGRHRIRRLGLDAIVVNGTDPETLRKGPGRHLRTFMPGEEELIYLAAEADVRRR